jgi:membrane-anchored mycosin MYCP
MRGRGAAGRPAALLTAGILAAAAALVGAGAPAYAACTSPIPPGQPITELPWAQRWLAPERLDPLADGSDITVAVIDSGVGSHREWAATPS